MQLPFLFLSGKLHKELFLYKTGCNRWLLLPVFLRIFRRFYPCEIGGVRVKSGCARMVFSGKEIP